MKKKLNDVATESEVRAEMVQNFQTQLIQMRERYAEEQEEKRMAMQQMQTDHEMLETKFKELEKVNLSDAFPPSDFKALAAYPHLNLFASHRNMKRLCTLCPPHLALPVLPFQTVLL